MRKRPGTSERSSKTGGGWPAAARLAAALVAMFVGSSAMGQLRIVNYNIAQLNGDQAALGDVIEALGIDDKHGWATPVTIFVFQEVQTADVAALQTLLNQNAPVGVTYNQATFTSSPGEDGSGGAQACFYRSNLVQEVVAGHVDISTGAGRNCDRWQFRLKATPSTTYTSNDAVFYLYSAHLKAGSASEDPQNPIDRNTGAQAIRNNANTLPAGSHIIVLGDMNLYANTEAAYVTFTTTGSFPLSDPLGTGSWAGSGNALKHTQSPCNTGCALVSGGMDDRFDFQLSSAQFQDADGLSYITGTYHAFGNDALHYNQNINNPANQYYPANLPRSDALADDLLIASDHIPVIVDYRIPAVMTATLDPTFGTVIEDAPVEIWLSVSNTAPVSVFQGADVLDYTYLPGAFTDGGGVNSVAALQPAEEWPFTVDTSTPGAIVATVQVTSNSEGCQNSNIVLQSTGTILRHANGSFSDVSDLDSTTVSISVDEDSGMHFINVPIHNFGYTALQALLDIDSVSPLAAPFGYTGPPPAPVGASPTTLMFTFDADAARGGLHTANVTINVSDQDLPGATSGVLNLTLEVDVTPLTPCTSDITNDGIVGIADLLAVIGAWGPCAGKCPPSCGTDVTDDCNTGIADLLAVIGAWGACP